MNERLDETAARDAAGEAPALNPAEAAGRGVALPWSTRLIDALGAYIPLLVMALFALGSWWLVKNTPLFDSGRVATPPRHIPDYTMTRFTVQRFNREGVLRGQLEGDVMRHYPDTDTIEVDNPRVRGIGDDGGVTRATARRALSNADGSEVQLFEDAHVVHEATANREEIDFRGEFLHAFLNTEQVRSHLPVVITQAGSEMSAASMAYDNLSGVVDFQGRSRAVFADTARNPKK